MTPYSNPHTQPPCHPATVTASAPGSTIIMGEHAVLHGYGAIVAALAPRLRVCIVSKLIQDDISHTDKTVCLLTIQSKVGRWQGDLIQALNTPLNNHPLCFALGVIQYLYQHKICTLPTNNLSIHIEITSELDTQLGLGSSAALTVALTFAWMDWCGVKVNQAQLLKHAVHIIRHVQGGGSGADAAASCYGGILYYDANTIQAQPIAHTIPSMMLLSVGYKTPTPTVINLVNTWAKKAPQKYATIYKNMGACVNQALEAITTQDWRSLAVLMQEYQTLMHALGVCDANTQKLLEAIHAHQENQNDPTIWAAKISGSGLGDCVLGIGVTRLPQWPHPQRPLNVDNAGVNTYAD